MHKNIVRCVKLCAELIQDQGFVNIKIIYVKSPITINIYEIVVGSVSCKFQYNHNEPYRHWSQHSDWHVLSIVDVALHILTAESTTTVSCQKSMQSCLFCFKPLPKPILIYWKQSLWRNWIWAIRHYFKLKSNWKGCPQNISHFSFAFMR